MNTTQPMKAHFTDGTVREFDRAILEHGGLYVEFPPDAPLLWAWWPAHKIDMVVVARIED